MDKKQIPLTMGYPRESLRVVNNLTAANNEKTIQNHIPIFPDPGFL